MPLSYCANVHCASHCMFGDTALGLLNEKKMLLRINPIRSEFPISISGMGQGSSNMLGKPLPWKRLKNETNSYREIRGNRNNAGRRETLQRRCHEDCRVESLFIPETITAGYCKTTQYLKQLLGFRDLMADIKMGYIWSGDKMRKFPRKQNFQKGKQET